MRCLSPIIVLMALLIPLRAASNEFRYVSNEELADELQRRRSDVTRTEERLASLHAEVLHAEQAFRDAAAAEEKIAALVQTRARVFYRLSKDGRSLRFLLQSDEVVETLRRFTLLKRLLLEGLVARREAGMRVAAAEKRLASLKEDKNAALQMHAMLAETLAQLESEAARREGDNPR